MTERKSKKSKYKNFYLKFNYVYTARANFSMIRLFITGILLMVTNGILLCQKILHLPSEITATDPEERNMIMHSWALYKNRHVFDAIRYLKKIVKQRPLFHDAHYYLGCYYQEIQNHEKAIMHFSCAIRTNARRKELYFLRGNSYAVLGYYRPALSDYVATIRLDPDFYAAYNNIAYVKIMNQGHSGNIHIRDVEIARQEIAKMLEQLDHWEISDKSVYFNMGILHLRLGMHEKAAGFLQHATELDSSCAKCYFYLALAYFYQRQYTLARQYFSRSWQGGYNTQRVEDFIEYIAKVEDYLNGKTSQ